MERGLESELSDAAGLLQQHALGLRARAGRIVRTKRVERYEGFVLGYFRRITKGSECCEGPYYLQGETDCLREFVG